MIDMPFCFCTIYDIVRDPYFYLGETVLQGIPDAVNFVVSTFVIVEMAEGGDEGIVYGLLTTTYNVGGPFASAISNQLFGLFEPKLSDPELWEDRPTFRNTVALSLWSLMPRRSCHCPWRCYPAKSSTRRGSATGLRKICSVGFLTIPVVGLVCPYALNGWPCRRRRCARHCWCMRDPCFVVYYIAR